MEKLTNKELIKLLDEKIKKQENKCNKISNQVQTLSTKEKAEKETKIKELNETIEKERKLNKKLQNGREFVPLIAGLTGIGAGLAGILLALFGIASWAGAFCILTVFGLGSSIGSWFYYNKKQSQSSDRLLNVCNEMDILTNQKSEKLENLLTKEEKAKNVLQQLIEERNTLVNSEKIKREKRRYITNRIKKQRENNEELIK